MPTFLVTTWGEGGGGRGKVLDSQTVVEMNLILKIGLTVFVHWHSSKIRVLFPN